MYLSRVELNPYRQDTKDAINNLQLMHGAVEASFNYQKGGERTLWRLDNMYGRLFLLVQSRRYPDFTHVIEQYGRPGSEDGWDVMKYDDKLDGIRDGDIYDFRLRANPVKLVSASGARPKPVGLCKVEDQLGWLNMKSWKCGFSINDPSECRVVQSGVRKSIRKERVITVQLATFEGRLEVTDADAFRESIISGIGRAKAFGCGLLTISALSRRFRVDP